MGIEDQLCAAGYQIEHLRSVDSDGAVKADFHVGAVRGLIGDDFTSLPRGDWPQRSTERWKGGRVDLRRQYLRC